MNNHDLLNAIKAAKIHKETGKYIRSIIKPNMSLREIAILTENKIKELTFFNKEKPIEKGIGFPVGLSINNCAAHYTPNYQEIDIILNENDLLKIDYGVQLNGTIIDSAFTLHFNPKYEEFIDLSKSITNYAVSLCGPDAILGEIGKDIEEYIKSKEIEIDNIIYPINIMKDLSGHMIANYKIHAGKAVPNIAINYPLRMKEFEFYAIEPFISTGDGCSFPKTPISHYMLNTINNPFIVNNLKNEEKKLFNLINNNFYTLPFCQRWLYELDFNINHNLLLQNLENKKIITSYPPLYDKDNSFISQFEHTIFIKENGIINLTKNDFY
jgi:methionyl aminopeptidase